MRRSVELRPDAHRTREQTHLEMKEMRNFWLVHKHDVLAGSFATVSMIFVLQLLFGNSAADIPPASVAQTSPPPALGVVIDAADTPDTLARAGDERERPEQTADKTEEQAETESANQIAEATSEETQQREETESTENDTDTTEQLAENETSSEVSREADTASNSNDEANDDGVTSAEQLAKATSESADDRPKSNPVESAPKPVEQMSAAELEAAVEAYETWVHEGDLKLLLDYSQLSVDQLDSIAQLYVASTKHSTLWITPDGGVKSVELAAVPAGKLVGDLPPDRSKWPPVLAYQARERFGRSFVAKANFLLTDAVALQLYRVLAQAVGTEQPNAGTQITLRLQPSGQDINVQLVGYK